MNIKTNIIYNLVVVALNVPCFLDTCGEPMHCRKCCLKTKSLVWQGALQSYILQQHNIY